MTALALTHSALHNLAIPHIYSRFDIVWPDAHATTDPRTGVDALTYGLATLCMGNISTPTFQGQFPCSNCGTLNVAECSHGLALGPQNEHRRLGNHYPQFTRKFSLGNGPPDWVQEYLITKESGKMLGTLVALAVARMVNLETFVWDMPTGVLRDVWMALSSLQTRNATQHCRLERVWVRWHDNSETPSLSTGPNTSPAISANTGINMTAVGWAVPPSSGAQSPSSPLSYSQARVEYPTLSVLPPLKSLSVLDVDELDYLDEMSVLIAKSKDCLRELRVGISEKAYKRDFANAWDGPDLQQVDHNASWPGESTIGERRLGGVLGVLLGRVFDIRKNKKAKNHRRDRVATISASSPNPPSEYQTMESHITGPLDIQNGDSLQEYTPAITENGTLGHDTEIKESDASEGNIINPGVTFNISGQPLASSPTIFDLNAETENFTVGPTLSDIDSLTALISGHNISEPTEGFDHGPLPIDTAVSTQAELDSLIGLLAPQNAPQEQNQTTTPLVASTDQPLRRSQSQSQKQLRFSDSLSSERERLEGKLRLQTLELERVSLSVAVLQKGVDWSILTNITLLDCQQHDRLWIMLRKHFQPSPLSGSNSTSKHPSSSSLQYHLNLKKVHTDTTSPALISFLKETLAPNTLETLFLQDRKRSSGTNVTIVRDLYHITYLYFTDSAPRMLYTAGP